MYKPTTIRIGDVYMCSLDTGSVYIFAHAKTREDAYSAWVDKLIWHVNYNNQRSTYLQDKIDAAHYKDVRARYKAKAAKPSVWRKVMNYCTRQDSIV